MHLLTLGLNHQTAPLALRERVAFVPEEVGSTITRLRERLSDRSRGRVTEAAIVSTCNRTELYCAVEQPQAAGPALADFVAQHKRLDTDEFRRSAYLLPQADAVRHAFRVASGLDSMVLGEPQILGQMKQAERLSREAGGLGLLLNHLFQRTFAVAKEVRSSTEIGAHSVSMAAAAVRVAESIFGELADSDVLLVGAGEMIELTATHIAARRPKSITVANRTVERATSLAHRFQGQAMRLAELPENLGPLRHRGLVHREHAADHRPGHGRAGDQASTAAADVHRRSRGTARRRARGLPAGRRLRLHGRRPRQDRHQRHREPAGGRRAGRGDHRVAGARLRRLDPHAAAVPVIQGCAAAPKA